MSSLFEWGWSSSHKFGDYNITLEATDNNENSGTSTINVVVDPSLISTTNSDSSTTTSTSINVITTSLSSTSNQNERSETDSADSPSSPLNGFIFPTSILVFITIYEIRKKHI